MDKCKAKRSICRFDVALRFESTHVNTLNKALCILYVIVISIKQVMGYQKVFQSSLVASFAVLLGILCFVSGFGEASLSNNVQRGAYQQVSPVVQVSPTVQVQVTPVVTQQCQKVTLFRKISGTFSDFMNSCV
jgi:hypothetical protein